MARITIEGENPEEVEEMIIFCSGITTEDTLDEVRSDYMKLHQNLLRVESKIPDTNKMFDETYQKVKKMLEKKDARPDKETKK